MGRFRFVVCFVLVKSFSTFVELYFQLGYMICSTPDTNDRLSFFFFFLIIIHNFNFEANEIDIDCM